MRLKFHFQFKDLGWYFHQKTETTPAQCECGNGWKVVGAGVSEKCTNCDSRGNLNYSIEKVISQFLMKDGHEIIKKNLPGTKKIKASNAILFRFFLLLYELLFRIKKKR